jgi:hypothetical protein
VELEVGVDSLGPVGEPLEVDLPELALTLEVVDIALHEDLRAERLGDRQVREAQRLLRLEVAPVIREILGALASGTSITDEQWNALAEVRLFGKSLFMRPGFIEVEPSVDPNSTALYRAHHNLDRAVEALTLWRGDNPDYAEIVYATEQVSKEEQLWPARISS